MSITLRLRTGISVASRVTALRSSCLIQRAGDVCEAAAARSPFGRVERMVGDGWVGTALVE